jgi:hypothetical protein
VSLSRVESKGVIVARTCLSFTGTGSEGVVGVLVTAADTSTWSLLVDVEAEVEVAVVFADASLSFLRRMRDERLRDAMLRVASSCGRLPSISCRGVLRESCRGQISGGRLSGVKV